MMGRRFWIIIIVVGVGRGGEGEGGRKRGRLGGWAVRGGSGGRGSRGVGVGEQWVEWLGGGGGGEDVCVVSTTC